MKQNIDFIAVLVITFVMLGINSARSSHWQEAQGWIHEDWMHMDSIRVIPAVQIERCPLTTDFFSRLTSILPH
ncbi:MAG TPA: hypothetical protein VME17_09830 [Bryobacteraceae bacterium]|nr:hypothetical protein [Bryobacteraceae bacterium]